MLDGTILFEVQSHIIAELIIDFYETFCSNNMESQPFIHVCQSVVTVFWRFVRKYLTT